VKKVHGEENPRDFEDMRASIEMAAEEAISKKRRILEHIKGKRKN
jgi:hydrogenase expression/formation protein